MVMCLPVFSGEFSHSLLRVVVIMILHTHRALSVYVSCKYSGVFKEVMQAC